MLQAIVYTSKTGTTREYALLLKKRTGLPAYTLPEAEKALTQGAEIIYLGWLMASDARGYKKAAARYQVRALCGVGMGATGTQVEEIRKRDAVPEAIPVFTLQGGFDLNKLHGIYKFMMTAMKKTAGKKLAEKTDRTPDEDDMLDMMMHGGSRVRESNLDAVLSWYQANK